MVKPVSPPRPAPRAALAWLLDAAGAVLTAGGIALTVEAALQRRMPWPGAACLLAAGLVRAAAQGAAQVLGDAAARQFQTTLANRMIPALLPSRQQRGALIGEDMHLAVDSVIATDGWVARFLPVRTSAGLAPLLIAAAAAPASWVAALIMLTTLVPLVIGMVLAGSAAARKAEASHRTLTRLSGLFVDRLRALPTVLATAAEDRVTRHLAASAREAARQTMAVLAVAFASSAILDFFAALSVALVAVYCGFALLGLLPFPAPEHLSVARAFYVLALAPEFYLGLRRLAAAYHDKQQGEAALAAINRAVAALPTPPCAIPSPQVLSGRAVRLGHVDGPEIGPLDWEWHGPGLHLVGGPTGAGKSSTLLALIGQVGLRAGAILADGRPLAPGALNGAIGWAGQKVALLPGTLRTNLAPGGADDAALLDCLARLGLGAVLAARGGLEMVIDHRGSGLSGGERRRIGLARAILSGRPILLLDEPTADLDPASARAVRAVLGELAATRLVIAASHDRALGGMARSVLEIAA